jgi:hypothetical protein
MTKGMTRLPKASVDEVAAAGRTDGERRAGDTDVSDG